MMSYSVRFHFRLLCVFMLTLPIFASSFSEMFVQHDEFHSQPPRRVQKFCPKQSRSDPGIYFALHVIGVVCVGIALGIHDIYTEKPSHEWYCFVFFYLLTITASSVSIYIAVCFQTPSLLLAETAFIGYLINRNIPRIWSTRFRYLHLEAPMWRTKKGLIFKRMRRKPKELEACQENPQHNWNGDAYTSTLMDGSPMIYIEEDDYEHWEQKHSQWMRFMRLARMGLKDSQRAASALRMACSVPLPAYISVGKTEYHSMRGSLGTEVAHVWNIPQRDLEQLAYFNNNERRKFIACNRHEDLALYLHMKMLSADDDKGRFDESWTNRSQEWLLGELFASKYEMDQQESETLSKALAYGKVDKCPENSEQKYWYLLKREDAEDMVLERAPQWRTENNQIIITVRHVQLPQELLVETTQDETRSAQGPPRACENNFKREIESEDQYWERKCKPRSLWVTLNTLLKKRIEIKEDMRKKNNEILSRTFLRTAEQRKQKKDVKERLERMTEDITIARAGVLAYRMARNLPFRPSRVATATHIAIEKDDCEGYNGDIGAKVQSFWGKIDKIRNATSEESNTTDGSSIVTPTSPETTETSDNTGEQETDMPPEALRAFGRDENSPRLEKFDNLDDLTLVLLVKILVFNAKYNIAKNRLVLARDWLLSEMLYEKPDDAELKKVAYAHGPIEGRVEDESERNWWYLLRSDDAAKIRERRANGSAVHVPLEHIRFPEERRASRG